MLLSKRLNLQNPEAAAIREHESGVCECTDNGMPLSIFAMMDSVTMRPGRCVGVLAPICWMWPRISQSARRWASCVSTGVLECLGL
jgi:hypothetical protein